MLRRVFSKSTFSGSFLSAGRRESGSLPGGQPSLHQLLFLDLQNVKHCLLSHLFYHGLASQLLQTYGTWLLLVSTKGNCQLTDKTKQKSSFFQFRLPTLILIVVLNIIQCFFSSFQQRFFLQCLLHQRITSFGCQQSESSSEQPSRSLFRI